MTKLVWSSCACVILHLGPAPYILDGCILVGEPVSLAKLGNDISITDIHDSTGSTPTDLGSNGDSEEKS